MVVKSYALKIFENTEDSHPFFASKFIYSLGSIQNPSTAMTEAFEATMSAIMCQADHLMPMIDANDKHLLQMERDLLLLQELVSCKHSSIVGAQCDVLGGFG